MHGQQNIKDEKISTMYLMLGICCADPVVISAMNSYTVTPKYFIGKATPFFFPTGATEISRILNVVTV
jgi:hypothetical protein